MVQRAPNGEGRENEDESGSFALSETESGPDHDWSTDERDRIILRGNRKPTAKNHLAKSEQQEPKESNLNNLRAVPAPGRCDKPQDDKGREEEVASEITKTPCDPDYSVMRGVSTTAQS